MYRRHATIKSFSVELNDLKPEKEKEEEEENEHTKNQ